MKLFKRIASAALVAAMSVSTLVGCSHGSASSSSGDGKPEFVTLNCYSQLANSQGTQQGWFAQILKDKFNVELNIVMETGNTFSTLCEKGDLGDLVVWGSVGDEYHEAVQKGLLLDWEANNLLAEHGSYIAENTKAALEYNRELSETGKVYGIGHSIATNPEDHDQFFYSWDLRYDYYQELGFPEIKNLDDLHKVLADMKKNHPTDDNGKETYGISLWPDWDGNMVMYPKALATAYYGYDELALGLYNNETGEYYDALMVNDDGTYGPYIEMLKYLNDLYQDGLLDPDSGTQTYDEATAKIKTGRSFWSIFNYAGSAVFNSDVNLADGKAMLTVVPEEATPCVYGMNVRGGNRVWTIGANTNYAGRCMDIINYLTTPEGWLDQQYGPEGLCWVYKDADGNVVPSTEVGNYEPGSLKAAFTELGKLCNQDVNTQMKSDDEKYADYCGKSFKDGQQQMNNLTWAVGAYNPRTAETYDCKNWSSESVPPAAGSIEAIWREKNDAVSADDYLNKREHYSVALASSFSEGKKDSDMKDIWEQVTTVIVNYSWRAILADSDAQFETEIKDMIEKANAYDNGKGYEKCKEWSFDEAARRKAAEDEVVNSTK